jgi:uncharacterized protein YjbJ (UPF0337 family)
MGTQDKARRAMKDAKGKAKEGWGKLVDDPGLETEGRVDQIAADAGDVTDNVAEQVKRTLRDGRRAKD